MWQVDITEAGDPDVLRWHEAPDLIPGPGQVLLDVAASGVNRLDCLQRAGFYPPPPGASPVPGLEVAGVVRAVGDGVGTVRPGQAVCALLTGGGYATQAVADSGLCLPVPATWTLEQAAATPEAAFTVWSMIWQRCALQPGETVLVQGGSSGVGSFAVQLARALGHEVLATAGSEAKCEVVRRLGATAVVNHKDPHWPEAVLDATGGRGVDVVLDMVGGPYLGRHLDVMADDGRLAIIAFLGGARGELNTAQLLKKRLTVTASTLRNRPLAFKTAIAAALRDRVWPLLEQGRVAPLIDDCLPMSQASEAHRRLEGGQVSGKLVLRP